MTGVSDYGVEYPVVAFTSWTNSSPPNDDKLIALHGNGSGEVFSVGGMWGKSNVLFADVGGDSNSELITVYSTQSNATVIATDAQGQEMWRTDSLWVGMDYDVTLTAADIDGDGGTEVVVKQFVMDGNNGDVLFQMDVPNSEFFHSVVADLDLDGTAEIMLGEKVYSHEGDLEWESPYWDVTHTSAVVVNVDDDPEGEVVFTCKPWIATHDTNGDLLDLYEVPDGQLVGTPCAADFDGDGDVEFGLPTQYRFQVYELDGTQLVWEHPTNDSSNGAGCTAFDFDNDGAYEILYADHYDFYIFDGTTGEVRFQWENHDSETMVEYPTIADVDDDGSAEIVLACNEISPNQPPNGDCRGIRVFGHAEDGWPPAGPSWGIHDYAPMRVRSNGTVPSPIPAPWMYYNMFRARPPGDGLADLFPVEGEQCIASCDHGPVKVSWGIANQGLNDGRGSIPVSLYRIEGNQQNLIQTQFVEDIRYGDQKPGGTFELALEDWGTDGIRIIVDDDGTGVGLVDECDEDNNVWEIPGPICE